MVVNCPSKERVVLSLKKAMLCPLLKELLLNSTILYNFNPVSAFPFLGNVVEKIDALQLQRKKWVIGSIFNDGSGLGMGLRWP